MKTEISQLIQAYGAAFRPGNESELPMFFAFPVHIIVHGDRAQIASPDELEQLMSATLEALAENNFSHSELEELHVHSLSQYAAIVSTRFNRLKKDGSLLEEIAATYHVFRSDGEGWKIVGITVHDTDKLVGR